MVDSGFDSRGERPQSVELKIPEKIRRQVGQVVVQTALQIAQATITKKVEYAAAAGIKIIKRRDNLTAEALSSNLHTTEEPSRVSDVQVTLEDMHKNNGVTLTMLHSHPGGNKGLSAADVDFWETCGKINQFVLNPETGQPYAIHGLGLPINGIVVLGDNGLSLHILTQVGTQPDIASLRNTDFGVARLFAQLSGQMREIAPGIEYGIFWLNKADEMKNAESFISRRLPQKLTLPPLPKQFFGRMP